MNMAWQSRVRSQLGGTGMIYGIALSWAGYGRVKVYFWSVLAQDVWCKWSLFGRVRCVQVVWKGLVMTGQGMVWSGLGWLDMTEWVATAGFLMLKTPPSLLPRYQPVIGLRDFRYSKKFIEGLRAGLCINHL